MPEKIRRRTGAVIARRVGEGDRREAERVAYQGLVTSMLVSFFFAAISLMSGGKAPFL